MTLDFMAPRLVASIRECDDAKEIVSIDEWSRQPFLIHVTQDAFVVGGPFPVCVLERGQTVTVLSETSDYVPWAAQWGETAFLNDGNAELVGEVDEACCLSLPHNFCHWHQEALPKICLMEKMGFRGRYIVADVPMFIESLELVGIDRNRIYPLDRGHLRVARLYVPQPLPLLNNSLFPMALWDARVRCLAAAEATLAAPRLYIGRSQGTHRHIVGEEAFLAELDRFGFVSAKMEDFSLRQQIGLASTAKVVIGPHGAGMANTLFMQQHGFVFEMFSPMYINSCVLPLCRILDLSYFSLVSRVNPVGGYRHGENILPDMNLVRYYLDRYLA